MVRDVSSISKLYLLHIVYSIWYQLFLLSMICSEIRITDWHNSKDAVIDVDFENVIHVDTFQHLPYIQKYFSIFSFYVPIFYHYRTEKTCHYNYKP